MSRAAVTQLVTDLTTGLADPDFVAAFYAEALLELARETELLVQVASLEHGAGSWGFEAPKRAVNILACFYDGRLLSESRSHAIAALAGPNWRDQLGVPSCVVYESEGDRRFRLWPVPNATSQDRVDFREPADTIQLLYTMAPTEAPTWADLFVALTICAREFARPSDHQDLTLVEHFTTVRSLVGTLVLSDA